MVRLFVRHSVADYAAWRKVYDEFDAQRRPMGVVGHAVYQALNDPNDVTVWHDIATLEQAEAFRASEALRSGARLSGSSRRPNPHGRGSKIAGPVVHQPAPLHE